jgi:uncharacterized protein (TIGR03067 family)
MIAKCACLLPIMIWLLASVRPATAEAPKKETELQGTWKLMRVETDDDTAENNVAGLPSWVIKGDKVLYGGEDLAVLTVDPTTTPKCIDLAFVQPKRVLEGVYSLEGDKLTICVNRATAGPRERPLDFEIKDTPERRRLVFQRTKAGDAENLSGFVGVAIRVDPAQKAVIVGEVLPGSPAQKAGLQKGDVLVRIGPGVPTDLRGAIGLVQQVRPGSHLTIRVERGGKEQDIRVRVGVVPFFLLN